MIIKTIEDVNSIVKIAICNKYKTVLDFSKQFNIQVNNFHQKINSNCMDLGTFIDVLNKCDTKVYIGTELIENCNYLKIFLRIILKNKEQNIREALLPYTYIINNAKFFFKDLLKICDLLGLEIETKK